MIETDVEATAHGARTTSARAEPTLATDDPSSALAERSPNKKPGQ